MSMSIGTERRIVRRATPPKIELNAELDALSQDALVGLVLFQRARISELEAERLGLIRTIVSQQRRLRDERAREAASRCEQNG